MWFSAAWGGLPCAPAGSLCGGRGQRPARACWGSTLTAPQPAGPGSTATAGPGPRSLCQVGHGTALVPGLLQYPLRQGLAQGWGSTAPILHLALLTLAPEGTGTPWEPLTCCKRQRGCGGLGPRPPPQAWGLWGQRWCIKAAQGMPWPGPMLCWRWEHPPAPCLCPTSGDASLCPCRTLPGGPHTPRGGAEHRGTLPVRGQGPAPPGMAPWHWGGCSVRRETSALLCHVPAGPGQGPRCWGGGSSPSALAPVAAAPLHPALPHRSAHQTQPVPRSAPTGSSSPSALRPDHSHQHWPCCSRGPTPPACTVSAPVLEAGPGHPPTAAAAPPDQGCTSAEPEPWRHQGPRTCSAAQPPPCWTPGTAAGSRGTVPKPRCGHHLPGCRGQLTHLTMAHRSTHSLVTADSHPRMAPLLPAGPAEGPGTGGRYFYITRFPLVLSCFR